MPGGGGYGAAHGRTRSGRTCRVRTPDPTSRSWCVRLRFGETVERPDHRVGRVPLDLDAGSEMARGLCPPGENSELLTVRRGKERYPVCVQSTDPVLGDLARQAAHRPQQLPHQPHARRPAVPRDGRGGRSPAAGKPVRVAGQRSADWPDRLIRGAAYPVADLFPGWFRQVEIATGNLVSRLLPDDFHACMQALVEGGYDFFLTFYHSGVAILLEPELYPHLVVGSDSLVAVSRPEPGHGARRTGTCMAAAQPGRR